MLVLSRRTEEAVVIGDDVRIKVLAIEGGVVRLGIAAPDEVRIMRSELLTPAFAGDGPSQERSDE